VNSISKAGEERYKEKTSFCMIQWRHPMNQKKNQGSRRPVMLYHADNQACTTCKASM
jgi:hypothetical protein